MEHSEKPMQCRCRECLRATSAALFDLRDALVELSLALKDLQFNCDLAQRKVTEGNVKRLLEQIGAASAGPGP